MNSIIVISAPNPLLNILSASRCSDEVFVFQEGLGSEMSAAE